MVSCVVFAPIFVADTQGFSPSLQRARKPFLVPNIIVGSLVCLFAGSVYVYSISAVKQDDFVSLPPHAFVEVRADGSPTSKTCYRPWSSAKTPVRSRTTCAIRACRRWGPPWTARYNRRIRRRRSRSPCRRPEEYWGTCPGDCPSSSGSGEEDGSRMVRATCWYGVRRTWTMWAKWRARRGVRDWSELGSRDRQACTHVYIIHRSNHLVGPVLDE